MGSSKKTIAYRYDSVGNRVGMTDPDGGRFTYAYDAVNRITHLENPQGDRTTYGYDPAGRRSVKKLANGTRASFTYDAAGNLTTLANLKSDNTVISSFDYAYDRMGNRTSVVEADGSRVTWTYDATYQLTGEHRTGSHPYEDSYSYDAAGNRLLKIHDGARTTTTYDAANQIRFSEDALGRTTYTFDANGNQTGVQQPNGDRTTTSWDFENRTTLVEEASGVRNTMAYEPGGLRVKLEESTGTKKFIWDEQNYLAETDENDDTQVVYTNEPRVYGNLVSQWRGSDSHWYHFDAIGSTRELTNSAETVTDTRLYDAWGTLVKETGLASLPLQYIGQYGYYFSRTLNTHYVRTRRVFSRIGRWVSPDPLLGLQWNEAMSAGITNSYQYAHGNPITRFDPTGLMDVSIIRDDPERPLVLGPCGGWRVTIRYEPDVPISDTFLVLRDKQRLFAVQEIHIYDGEVTDCEQFGLAPPCACHSVPPVKPCTPCCYLELLRTRLPNQAPLEEENKLDYSFTDTNNIPAYAGPGCTSQGNWTVTATVKVIRLNEATAPLMLSLGAPNQTRECDAGCKTVRMGSIGMHVPLPDCKPPAAFLDKDSIVDEVTVTSSAKWDCCGRFNQQTVVYPDGTTCQWSGWDNVATCN